MAQPPGKETRASPHPREQRRHDPKTGPHTGDEFIRRSGIHNIARRKHNRLAAFLGLAQTLTANRGIDPVIAQNPHQKPHIGQAWHIVQSQRFARQDARDHQRQGSIFRAGNRDDAFQCSATADTNTIHVYPLYSFKAGLRPALIRFWGPDRHRL